MRQKLAMQIGECVNKGKSICPLIRYGIQSSPTAHLQSGKKCWHWAWCWPPASLPRLRFCSPADSQALRNDSDI